MRRGGDPGRRVAYGYIPTYTELMEISLPALYLLFMTKIKYTAIFLIDQLTFCFGGGAKSPPAGAYLGKEESFVTLPEDFSVGRITFGLNWY